MQPGNPIVFSHSELESAQRCPFQHQLSYVERWSKPKAENTAAGKGTLWHKVMQVHYTAIAQAQGAATAAGKNWRSFDPEAALASAARDADRVIEAIQDVEVQELIRWMYDGYVDQHGVDPAWRIVGVELYGETPLRPDIADQFPLLPGLASNKDAFLFKYYVDLLVEESGRLFVVDHKTVHDFPKELDLDLDAQFDRYTWALNQEGSNVFGQQYNMARRRRLKSIQPLDSRHRRTRTHRSASELAQIADDMFISIYGRYAQQAHLTKIGAESPRYTSSRHCSYMCDFTDPCLMGRKGVSTREYLVSLGYQANTPRHKPS